MRALGWLFPSDPNARARRDRVLLVLGVLASVLLLARALRKDEGVLARNREFGARFLAHEDPYFDPARGHRVHGPYPPTYVLATVPLALVPERVARGAWAAAQIGALVALFALTRAWLARGWPALLPHASVVFALALLLASRFLLRDMAGGGGNLLYATGALWGGELALRGRALRGGGLLALSLVLKPNLAPLLLALAALRRFGALCAAVATALLLALLPALSHGIGAWIALCRRWVEDLVRFAAATDLDDRGAVPDGFPLADTTMNQAVREVLWRALPADLAAWGARLVSLALLATGARIALRARSDQGRIRALVLFLPVALLASPISWKAHHVALLPLFAVAIADAWAGRRGWLAGLLVVYYGACVLLAEELVGKAWKNALQETGVVTIGALALFAGLCVVARREEAGGAA